jgi:hypothetical protein
MSFSALSSGSLSGAFKSMTSAVFLSWKKKDLIGYLAQGQRKNIINMMKH